jgi:hypothetical protein
MTYVQWLGSWLESYPYYESYIPSTLKDVDLDAPAETPAP